MLSRLRVTENWLNLLGPGAVPSASPGPAPSFLPAGLADLRCFCPLRGPPFSRTRGRASERLVAVASSPGMGRHTRSSLHCRARLAPCRRSRRAGRRGADLAKSFPRGKEGWALQLRGNCFITLHLCRKRRREGENSKGGRGEGGRIGSRGGCLDTSAPPLLPPSREMGELDPVPSSAMNDCVPFSRSRVLSLPAFSPKINAVIVMMVIIEFILRCIFLHLTNSISNIWHGLYN